MGRKPTREALVERIVDILDYAAGPVLELIVSRLNPQRMVRVYGWFEGKTQGRKLSRQEVLESLAEALDTTPEELEQALEEKK